MPQESSSLRNRQPHSQTTTRYKVHAVIVCVIICQHKAIPFERFDNFFVEMYQLYTLPTMLTGTIHVAL